jgi:ferric-dicitrate binding protein FerR (iron transport regulator)
MNMRVSPTACKAWLAAAIGATLSAPALGATPEIGTTTLVVRTVTGTLATQVRQLVIHDGVQQNEIIATAPDAASEIEFVDGTKLTLGPRAHVTLDRFVYDPDPSRGSFFLSLSEGVFRFVTGQMAHRSYSITTPNGTIGVRGSTLEVLAFGGTTFVHVADGAAVSGGNNFNVGDYFVAQGGRSRLATALEISQLTGQVVLMDNYRDAGRLALIEPTAGGRPFALLFPQNTSRINTQPPTPIPAPTIETTNSVSPTHP